MEELVKFLENVGVSNETIALLKYPEEDLKVEDLAEEYKSAQRDVYKNDPDVLAELDKNSKGKARGSVERKIKKVFSISNEDWKENELEGDYEKALLFGFDKQKKEGSKSAQQLQTDLQEANKEIEWYKDEEIPRIKKVEKLKVDNFHVGRYLRELIGDSGKLADNIGNDVAEIVLKEELRKKGYVAGLTEDEKLAILTTEGTKPQDEKKTRNLSNQEIVKDVMVAKKLIKQSKADPDPEKPPTPRYTEPSSDPTPDLPHLAGAEENLKNLEKMEKDKGRGFGNLK